MSVDAATSSSQIEGLQQGDKSRTKKSVSSKMAWSWSGWQVGIDQKLKKLEEEIGNTKLGKVTKEFFAKRSQKLESREKIQEQLANQELELKKRMEAIGASECPSWEAGKLKFKQAWNRVVGFWERPTSYVSAIAKTTASLVLYDYNPVAKLIGKAWTAEWGDTGLSGRELAARLEEKLIIDKETGKGVRTGAISEERIRDAVGAGLEQAWKMTALPGIIAGIPVIEGLSVRPSDVYSLFRSAKMVSSGPGSLKGFAKLWENAETKTEKAKIVGTAIAGGLGFYALEKVSPSLLGVNPALMADIGLMRLSSTVDKHVVDATKEGAKLETSELHELLSAAELGITASFVVESSRSVAERVVTLAETGSLDPLTNMKTESDLIKLATDNPEYLGESGGSWLATWRIAEERFFGHQTGHQMGRSFELVDEAGVLCQYQTVASDEGWVVTRERMGATSVWDGKSFVEVATEQAGSNEEASELVELEDEVSKELAQAVHDYVVSDESGENLAIRMDLRDGESVEAKVLRIWRGSVDDNPQVDVLPGQELMEGKWDSSLNEYAGHDLVYERQIHEELVERLIVDAEQNGLKYSEEVVVQRLVKLLEDKTDLEVTETAEFEVEYSELYRYLFAGSEVDLFEKTRTQKNGDWESFYLVGGESSLGGYEMAWEIKSGDTLSGLLASKKFSLTESGVYEVTGNKLSDAKLFRIDNETGQRELVPWSEAGNVRPGEHYVLSTGIIGKLSDAGEMPDLIVASDVDSGEDTQISDSQLEEWYASAKRDSLGRIYLGEVGKDGSTLIEMISRRLWSEFENDENPGGVVATLYPMLVSQEAYGLRLYAETPSGEIRDLRESRDLDVLRVGEKLILVDVRGVLTQIPDLVEDETTDTSISSTTPVVVSPMSWSSKEIELVWNSKTPNGTISVADVGGYAEYEVNENAVITDDTSISQIAWSMWALDAAQKGSLDLLRVSDLLAESDRSKLQEELSGEKLSYAQNDRLNDWLREKGFGRTNVNSGSMTVSDIRGMMQYVATQLGPDEQDIFFRSIGVEARNGSVWLGQQDAKVYSLPFSSVNAQLVETEKGSYVAVWQTDDIFEKDIEQAIWESFSGKKVADVDYRSVMLDELLLNSSGQRELLGKAMYVRGEDGGWELSQMIRQQVSNSESLQFENLPIEARRISFDRAMIKLLVDDDRVISLTVSGLGEVMSVFDSANIGFQTEVVQFEGERQNTQYEDGMSHVFPVYKMAMDTSDKTGREGLVRYLNERGLSYDYLVFCGENDLNSPVVVATHYSEGGEESHGVKVGVVMVNGASQLSGKDISVVKDLLVKTSDTLDIEFYDHLESTDPLMSDDWESWMKQIASEQVNLNELEKRLDDIIPDGEIRDIFEESKETKLTSYAEYLRARTLALETLKIEGDVITEETWNKLPEEQRIWQPVISMGVEYLGLEWIPNYNPNDAWVMARNYGIKTEQLVVTDTKDPGMYLIGQRLEGGMLDPESENVHLYVKDLGDGTYEYRNSIEPLNEEGFELAAIYPVARPLTTLVGSEKLVPLESSSFERLFQGYKRQFADWTYYVPTEEERGSKLEVFVDPRTMQSYIYQDEEVSYGSHVENPGFYPLYQAGISIAEMAQVMGDPDLTTDEVIWQRQLDLAWLKTRSTSQKYDCSLSEDGIILYDKDTGVKEVKLVLSNELKEWKYDSKQGFVWSGDDGNTYIFKGSDWQINNRLAVDDLSGYSFVTDDDGVPMHDLGRPVLSKDNLMYLLEPTGLRLVGSVYDVVNNQDLLADSGLGEIYDKLGITKVVSIGQGYETAELSFVQQLEKLTASVSTGQWHATPRGLFNNATRESWRVVSRGDQVLVDKDTGALIFEKTMGDELASTNLNIQIKYSSLRSGDLTNYERTNNDVWIGKEVEFIEVAGHKLELWKDSISKEVMVDRQTKLPIYLDGATAYVLRPEGLVELGGSVGLLKSGLVGVFDDDQRFAIVDPSLSGKSWQEQLTVAAFGWKNGRMDVVEDALESFSRDRETLIANLVRLTNFTPAEVRNVLPLISGSEYKQFESLPPFLVQALVVQEDKRALRYADDEASNLHPLVLGQVILSDDGRGGSTLAQQVAKNMLMSAQERLDPEQRVIRKVKEFGLAQEILDDYGPEGVLELYVNSVTYGWHPQIGPIVGIERASRYFFGKELNDLSEVQMALLTVVPNHPERFNMQNETNILAWADAASSVYRHLNEEGILTTDQAEAGMAEVYTDLFVDGNEDYLQKLPEFIAMTADEKRAFEELCLSYQNVPFEMRFDASKKYIQLTDFGKQNMPDLMSDSLASSIKRANLDYLQSLGNLPSSTSTNLPYVRTMEIEKEVVDLLREENNGNVVIDAPEMHISEGVILGADGEPLVLQNIGDDNLEQQIFVGEDKVYLLENERLMPQIGQVYATDYGKVLAMAVDTRPTAVSLTSSLSDLESKHLVKDALGNVYVVENQGDAQYIGRMLDVGEQRDIIYKVPYISHLEVAQSGDQIYQAVVASTMKWYGQDIKMEEIETPITNDPDLGVTEVYLSGKLVHRANPSVVASLLEKHGIKMQPIELVGGKSSGEQVVDILNENITEEKPVWLWLNLTQEIELRSLSRGSMIVEGFGEIERPFMVIGSYIQDETRYFVLKDPMLAEPRILSEEEVVELAAPIGGRYRLLVGSSYELNPEVANSLVDKDNLRVQVEMAVSQNHVWDMGNPGIVEEATTINPKLQQVMTQMMQETLVQYDTSGAMGMMVDQDGNVIAAVNLDQNGKNRPLVELVAKPFVPGSVAKIVTALELMVEQGLSPQNVYKAGEVMDFGGGYEARNWRSFEGYSNLADETMTVSQAIADSNNPFFLEQQYRGGNPDGMIQFVEKVGFGQDQRDIPGWQTDGVELVTSDNAAVNSMAAIGQGNLQVTMAQMVAYQNALFNEGRIVAPRLVAMQQEPDVVGYLPGTPKEWDVIKEGEWRVNNYFVDSEGITRYGTAVGSFGMEDDKPSYEVYGKTGTAQTGDSSYPHASYIFTAVDQTTGEMVTGYLVFMNAGQEGNSRLGGGVIAAPVARDLLDKYFANSSEYQARLKTPIVTVKNGWDVVREEISEADNLQVLSDLAEHWDLTSDRNNEAIVSASSLVDLTAKYLTVTPSDKQSGQEMVSYWQEQIEDKDLLNNERVRRAMSFVAAYYNYQDSDQPVQCVGWQILVSELLNANVQKEVAIKVPYGSAVDVASALLTKEDGDLFVMTDDSGTRHGSGEVVRFANDEYPTISEMKTGDSIYVKYSPTAGHVLLIMDKEMVRDPLTNEMREAVLVADANHYVDQDGVMIEDGKPRLRWMTQDQFIHEYQTEGTTAFFAGNRSLDNTDNEKVEEEEEQRVGLASSRTTPEGYIVLGNAAYEPLTKLSSPDVKLITPRSIVVHWSGADNEDANSIRNAFESSLDSATMAVGQDGIIQLAPIVGNQTADTNAALDRSDVVNIEIAGNDFDNNPPSEETYKHTLEAIASAMVKFDIPLSEVIGHYEEYYVTMTDGRIVRASEAVGHDQNGDGYVDGKEVERVVTETTNQDGKIERTVWEGDMLASIVVWQKYDPGVKFMHKLHQDLASYLRSNGYERLVDEDPAIRPGPATSTSKD